MRNSRKGEKEKRRKGEKKKKGKEEKEKRKTLGKADWCVHFWWGLSPQSPTLLVSLIQKLPDISLTITT